MATISPYSVIGASVAAGGTGYSLGDVLTIQDGPGGAHLTAAQMTVAGVTGGVVTAVVPAVLGNYSVQAISPVTVTGGTGTNCTLNQVWATLYAFPADLFQRYDWREIGDLLKDADEQVSALDMITIGNSANSLLLQIFADAGGDVEAALLAAGRYANVDLYSLTGNSQALLKRIICEIVIAYIFERKPLYMPERMEQYGKAKADHLKKLQDGKNIFNLPLMPAAGQETVEGPSLIEYQGLNLVTDRCTSYFPPRVLPLGN